MPGRWIWAKALPALAGLLVATGLGLWALVQHQAGRHPTAPQDRIAADLQRLAQSPLQTPLRIVVLGTSLSTRQRWTADLETALSQCLNRQVTVEAHSKPGSNVLWGLDQTDAVRAKAPDVVLIEFAINDADLRDGVSLATAQTAHSQMVAALREAGPETGRETGPAVALMTMSPAHGLRGLLRPRLLAHYAQYGRLAADLDISLVDINARWRSLAPQDRGLGKGLTRGSREGQDGLHPDQAVASGVIVPTIVTAFGCAT